jgi:hypothetical protein
MVAAKETRKLEMEFGGKCGKKASPEISSASAQLFK